MDFLKAVKPLLMVKGKLSLGRLSFWLVLGVSLHHYGSLNAHWLTLLMALLTYNLTGKVLVKDE